MTSSNSLSEVTINTKEGDCYRFPCVLYGEVAPVLARPSLSSSSTLVIVNVSGACLTVPVRVIDTVYLDGEELWKKTHSSA